MCTARSNLPGTSIFYRDPRNPAVVILAVDRISST